MITFELFEKYFVYLSPSDMYKALNETTCSEENEDQINTIENRLTNLMEVLQVTLQMIEKNPENRDRVLEIVELILYFNLLNQAGQGLKKTNTNQNAQQIANFFGSIRSRK